jgi:hypothetical protein
VLLVASLAIALTIQQQDVAAFNDKNNQFVFNSHSHTQCPPCEGNDGHVFNSADQHINDNFNSNRDPTFKTNSFDKPGNDK